MIQPSWLDALIESYRDETVGAAGGRFVNMPEPYYNRVSGPPRLFVRPSGRVISKDAGLVSTAEVEVDHLIGCNMSFRRKALEQVGGFDPSCTGSKKLDTTIRELSQSIQAGRFVASAIALLVGCD